MGLDIVEMVMAVEERFGIEIPDPELAHVATAGDLHELICRKLRNLANAPGQCPCVKAFLRLRGAAREQLGSPARDARLDDLVSVRDRARFWKDVSEHGYLILPPLELPHRMRFLQYLPILLLLSVFPGCLASYALGHGSVAGTLLVFVLTLALVGLEFFIAVKLVVACMTNIPAECETWAGFVRTVADRNRARFSVQSVPPTEGQIWRELTGLLSEWARVKAEDIRLESHLRKDLGLG